MCAIMGIARPNHQTFIEPPEIGHCRDFTLKMWCKREFTRWFVAVGLYSLISWRSWVHLIWRISFTHNFQGMIWKDLHLGWHLGFTDTDVDIDLEKSRYRCRHRDRCKCRYGYRCLRVCMCVFIERERTKKRMNLCVYIPFSYGLPCGDFFTMCLWSKNALRCPSRPTFTSSSHGLPSQHIAVLVRASPAKCKMLQLRLAKLCRCLEMIVHVGSSIQQLFPWSQWCWWCNCKNDALKVLPSGELT